MKKIYILVLMAVSVIGLSIVGVKATANEETLRTEADEMAEFVGSHLTEFKKEYNKKYDKPLQAKSIESYCLTYIIDEDEYGVYIDFDGNHGYLLTTFSYVLYALETEGDLPYLRNLDLAYYSMVDGFVDYVDNHYVKYNEMTTYRNEETVYGYNGQTGSGEGKIYDIDSYMADRYPSYKLEGTVDDILNSYGGIYTMGYLSTFLKYKSTDGGYTYPYVSTEGNCALVAVFNVLSSWGETGYFPAMPARTKCREDFPSIILNSPLYQEYGTGVGGVGISFYWTLNQEAVSHTPELYFYVWDYSVGMNNYTPVSGFTAKQSRDTFIACTSEYHHTIYPKTATSFADVMTSLDEDRAVFMGLKNTQSYAENHAVALLGYRKYSYTTGAWIFQKTHTAYFFIVDDGQTGGISYFDPNCNSSVSYEFIYN